MTSDRPPRAGKYDPLGAYPWAGDGTRPAGVGVRFGARIIDGIIVAIVGSIIVYALRSSSSLLVTGLFTGILTFGYFVALETTLGQTLGKKLLGLSVRGPAGARKPTLQQSAIRNLWTLLPVVPFVGGLLGVVAIIVIAATINGSPTKQGKHDIWAGGTQVVRS